MEDGDDEGDGEDWGLLDDDDDEGSSIHIFSATEKCFIYNNYTE